MNVKTWIFITEAVGDLWDKFNQDIQLLITKKLAVDKETVKEWKQAQNKNEALFNSSLVSLQADFEKVLTDAIQDAITNALNVTKKLTEYELKEFLGIDKDVKITDKAILMATTRVYKEQDKLIQATIKQAKIQVKLALNEIPHQIKMQEKLEARKPRLVKKTLYETVSDWCLDKDRELKVRYDNGRQVGIRTYAEMLVRTEVNNIANESMDIATKDTGIDLFLCSWHFDCADDHAAYQGKVYTTNPNKYKGKYIDKNKVMGKPVYLTTRPNCRHFFMPITEEQAKNPNDTLNKLNMKKGKSYKSENYDDLVAQRENERALIKWKLQRDKLITLRNNTKDPKEKLKINKDLDKCYYYISFWEKKQEELLKSNPQLTREFRRENATTIAYSLGLD